MKRALYILLVLPFMASGQSTDYELKFNSATQDYVEMPNASAVIANKPSFTVSGWVKPKANTDHGGLMGFRNNVNADLYLLQLQNTNNVEARFRNSTGANFDIVSVNFLDLDVWQHIAFTYDGGWLRLYKNGLITDSTAANGTMTQTTEPFKLGTLDWQTTGFYMNGNLDEIRLWDVALSAFEIKNWMCKELDSTHINYPSLMGYWNLNDGTGTVATDLSGNGNHGNLINTPAWVASSSTVVNTVTLCYGDSITVGTNTYNATGTYTDVFATSSLCDSTVITKLTVGPLILWQQAFTICDSDSITVGSSTYNTSGNYTDTLTASNGCDSTVYTNLTVNASNHTYDTISACNSYTWNGNTYTESGTYQNAATNAFGCDSMSTLDLTIDSVDNGIINSSPTLSAVESGATYQWLDCDNGYAIIQGETNQSFTPASSGSYAVTITKNSCTDTSTCETVTIVSVTKNEIPGLFIHPNPTKDQITIDIKGYSGPIDVAVYDLSGKKIEATHLRTINLNDYPTGTYLFKISYGNAVEDIKVIKE